MKKLATDLYREFNPGIPLKSPKAKHLLSPDHQNYGIRWFDKKRFKDFLQLITIDMQEILLDTMFPKTPSTKKYYRQVFESGDIYDKYHHYVFAITSPKHVIVGWIQYTWDEHEADIRKHVNINTKCIILEVSYAKLFNKNYKRVAVNGLKQSMDIIRKINNNNKREIYITGYTTPKNIASEYVLKTNGFEKLNEQITYVDEISNIWIKKIS